MPTKKPIIQTVVDDKTFEKFKEICHKEDRRASDMARIIIKKYVENYEKEAEALAEKERVKNDMELLTSKIG